MKLICFRNIVHYVVKSKCNLFKIKKQFSQYRIMKSGYIMLVWFPQQISCLRNLCWWNRCYMKSSFMCKLIKTIFVTRRCEFFLPLPIFFFFFVNRYLFLCLFILFTQYTIFSNFLIHSKVGVGLLIWLVYIEG